MCLDAISDPKLIDKLPEEFVAYKVMKQQDGRGFTAEYIHMGYLPFMFKSKNVSRKTVCTTQCRHGHKYVPHFHCFKTLEAARRWETWGRSIVKIKIKRQDVTCVGWQKSGRDKRLQTIITKAFTTDFEIVN